MEWKLVSRFLIEPKVVVSKYILLRKLLGRSLVEMKRLEIIENRRSSKWYVNS